MGTLLLYPETEFDLVSDVPFKNVLRDHDRRQENGNHGTHSFQETGHDVDDEAGSTILTPLQVLEGTGFEALDFRKVVKRTCPSLMGSFDGYDGSHQPFPNISLTTQDVTRWRMAWRAFRTYKLRDNKLRDKFSGHFPEALLVRRCRNSPDMYDIVGEPRIALGFSAAALIYGGLHALAWFAHFETSSEQLLWRISACVVMGGMPVAFFLWYLLLPLAPYVIFLEILLWLAYVLARAYLVVECFINLSHLPAEVYDIPRWSTYFPHIS